jgi:hypothetical protein
VVDERFNSLESRIVAKLGTMIVAGVGLLAALRFWN